MQTLLLDACQDISVTENTINTTDPYTYILIGGSSITFSHNTLSGKNLQLILGSIENSTIEDNLFAPGEGIWLQHGQNNNIIGNNITGGNIRVDYSKKNKITGNVINNSSKEYGIILAGSTSNTITKNTVQHGIGGVTLSQSRFNVISDNNLIDCGVKPAWFSNALLNRWSRNYWGAPHLPPKIIPGEIVISRGWPSPDIVIPVFTVDLFPRQQPIT
jgi:parallel beta-helix repeat protein